MKLTDWLKTHGIRQSAFAQQIGEHPSMISRLKQGAWPSREVFQKIWRRTGGNVTPNDYLFDCDSKPIQTAEPVQGGKAKDPDAVSDEDAKALGL